MPCAFCQRDEPLTKEHLWSDWIRRLIPQEGRSLHTRRYRTGDEAWSDEFETVPFTMQVRAVCEDCNSGWMGRLEDAVKPVLSGMIIGNGRSLGPDSQTALATWATVKTLMFQFLHPPQDRYAPRLHYKELYERQTVPPESVSVYLGRYGGTAWPGFYDHRTLVRAKDEADRSPERPQIYSATLSVGHVVVQVLGSTIGEPMGVVQRGHPDLDRAVRAIWPDPELFTFPPGPSLSERGLERLAGPPIPP